MVLAAQGKAHGMSWDGFQREVLAELGLAVYALAGATAVVEPPITDEPAPSPLLQALLRAAAATPGQDSDALALCQDFLAANPAPTPAARRALWPQLRRLRTRHA